MDESKKPYKMYAAVASAILSYLLTQTILSLPPVAAVSLNAALIGITVYLVPNPRKY